MLLLLLFWFFRVVDVVHGAAGDLENCKETHCKHNGPPIRFPFRVKDRQPIHCGYEGFDLSCTKDNQTVIEIPSSVYNKLFVKTIDYKFQEIEIYDPNGCLPKQLLNLSLSSSPFQSIYGGDDKYTTFSCPSSNQRDQLNSTWCMMNLSPCLGNNPAGSQIFAVSGSRYCSMDNLPLVSCTKVRDYTSVPVLVEPGINLLKLHWYIPSCEYCEMMKKKCRPATNYRYYPPKNDTECYAPKGIISVHA